MELKDFKNHLTYADVKEISIITNIPIPIIEGYVSGDINASPDCANSIIQASAQIIANKKTSSFELFKLKLPFLKLYLTGGDKKEISKLTGIGISSIYEYFRGNYHDNNYLRESLSEILLQGSIKVLIERSVFIIKELKPELLCSSSKSVETVELV